ncbi:DUF3570 domain-containing protein [Marinobacter salinexigens]|uniref:DUF3570 domain-containing protein n=1 Tax=Marinobacter salinexigens TaxID=2919747 RepID=A0A5B0VMR8_9GAMM|nr:DUF3570 domain-containing protein [Marinobacter salinexigens]KAA1175713.1 DUF3570 domain-containing protein [Marinobacter salinexigens]
MQLINDKKNGKPVGRALATATCALLGVQATTTLAKDQPGEWDVETALLIYSETDDRVQAAEPVISATRNFDGDKKLNLKLVADTLTGASPSGATPSDLPQTFTRPSGSGSYTVDAGEAPLDDSFKDTRVAVSGSWTAPLNRDYTYSVGAYGSREYDYLSTAVNGSLSRYLNNKNTTLTGGLSLGVDIVDPVGGAPVGLSRMALRDNKIEAEFDQEFAATRESDDTKTLVDALFGVTQVINRRTLMQFNYGVSYSSGYLTDPYKILSVIDESAGANYGGNLIGADGNPVYLYENRPDTRMKHSLYWQTKYMLDNGDVMDGSYRFMIDDWGITSHTIDLKYRWRLANSYLEPHFRYYMQSEADFYQRYLTESEYNSGTPTVSEASADYRLGELTGMTFGAKWGYRLDEDRELAIRAEYMIQSNDGDEGFGKLTSHDLYPDTNAMWLQLSYNF